MAKVKFTDAYVRNLKPREKRYEVYDAASPLTIRVTPAGGKSYLTRYRAHGGTNRTMTHGKVGVLSLADARQRSQQAMLDVQNDLDPSLEAKRAKQKTIDDSELTFAKLVDIWHERHAKRHNTEKTLQAYFSIINRELLPVIGDMPASEIKPRDLMDLLENQLERLEKEGKRGTQVIRTKALLTKIFRTAVARGLLDNDPTSVLPIRLSKRVQVKWEKKKKALTEDEITRLFKELPAAQDWMRRALLLLLYTGQRPSEVLFAKRKDFDLSKAQWRFDENKKDRAHVVPLSDAAVEIVRDQLATHNGPMLFRGKDSDRMEITSLSQATRRFCDEHKIERFKPQDLRRTVATHMRRLGIDRFIVDRVQNRVDGSVQGQHYDVHDYLQEKTEALNTWADELERLRG